MHSVNITAELAAKGAPPVKPGESYWKSQGGHLFLLYILHDHVVSHHGNECFRLQACQVDEAGAPLQRGDGKAAWDPGGHVHHMLSHSTDRTVRDALDEAIDLYLSRMDGAVVNARHSDDLIAAGLVVSTKDAHRIPENLNHLKGN